MALASRMGTVWSVWIAVLGAVCSEASGGDPERGAFHPRDAALRDERGHHYVWRERCGNNIPDDHQLAGGYEWEGDNRDYLALGECMVRGRRRGGLVLLSFPDGNRLRASWDVDIPAGASWRIEYALTDSAASHSINGLAFTVVATGATGEERAILERTLEPGDWKVYRETIRMPFRARRISFVHDNLGSESWDVLWIRPPGLRSPRSTSSSRG